MCSAFRYGRAGHSSLVPCKLSQYYEYTINARAYAYAQAHGPYVMGLDADGEQLCRVVHRGGRVPVVQVLEALNWNYARLEQCVNNHKRWRFSFASGPSQILLVVHVNDWVPWDQFKQNKRSRDDHNDEPEPEEEVLERPTKMTKC